MTNKKGVEKETVIIGIVVVVLVVMAAAVWLLYKTKGIEAFSWIKNLRMFGRS